MTSEPIDEVEILQLPYSERQLVVVSDDTIVKMARKAEFENSTKQGAVNWTDLIVGIMPLVSILIVAEATREAVKAWSKAREGGLRILQVAKSEIPQLTFPPGHPREGVLYVGHPAKPGLYYTAAEFHRVVFEHKVSEAINLLMHLGATKIQVEHLKGWSQEFAARLAVPLGMASEAISSEIGATNHSSKALLYSAHLRGAKTSASLPKDLVWYPHEPTWQSIAKGRLDFGLQDFSLSIIYEDDFGVNAHFKALAAKADLDLGGRFESHAATIWRISGEFAVVEVDAAAEQAK